MHGLMPNPLTKLSESTEEDEVLRSRKRKLDMEAESDGEQLREQLRLHLEDKRILNGDAGKRLRRDFGRLLKSGEEGVPMADIDYEIYKYINELADQYIELDDLLEQNEMDGPVFKIKDDPRITRVGKFIRKTSLDELPQLWNILKGDMSIVGPRPALPREVEQYGDYEKQRLYVTPGLSCYWQIAPHRNDLSFEEWMDLDVKYVKERSFWVDWKIIFKTFKVCLLGRGE